jgi:hypothetical protein
MKWRMGLSGGRIFVLARFAAVVLVVVVATISVPSRSVAQLDSDDVWKNSEEYKSLHAKIDTVSSACEDQTQNRFRRCLSSHNEDYCEPGTESDQDQCDNESDNLTTLLDQKKLTTSMLDRAEQWHRAGAAQAYQEMRQIDRGNLLGAVTQGLSGIVAPTPAYQQPQSSAAIAGTGSVYNPTPRAAPSPQITTPANTDVPGGRFDACFHKVPTPAAGSTNDFVNEGTMSLRNDCGQTVSVAVLVNGAFPINYWGTAVPAGGYFQVYDKRGKTIQEIPVQQIQLETCPENYTSVWLLNGQEVSPHQSSGYVCRKVQ